MKFGPKSAYTAATPRPVQPDESEKIRIIRDLDVKAFRTAMPQLPSDDVALIALHKARYETVVVEPSLRTISRMWLQSHNYGRHGNQPWPAEGVLES
jgi:hypothetical protein